MDVHALERLARGPSPKSPAMARALLDLCRGPLLPDDHCGWIDAARRRMHHKVRNLIADLTKTAPISEGAPVIRELEQRAEWAFE